MASKLRLMNSEGKVATLENNDSNMEDISMDIGNLNNTYNSVKEGILVSGTFTTTDGKTITITNGIVTSIV